MGVGIKVPHASSLHPAAETSTNLEAVDIYSLHFFVALSAAKFFDSPFRKL